MARFIDARIPVLIGSLDAARPDDALLLEGEMRAAGLVIEHFTPAEGPAHRVDCACCTPRSSVGQALSRLFLARARGTVGFFKRVLAVPSTEAGETAIRQALEEDPLASGWYRLS